MACSPYLHSARNVRILLYKHYRIAYLIKEDGDVDVLGVFHGALGLLSGRLVVVGYTPRGTLRHIFSMRKANDREKARLAPYFEI